MTISRLASLIAVLGVTLAVAHPESVVAADATQHDHSNVADSAVKTAAGTPAPASSTSAMHQMHAAHEKMISAKTPAERQAAMGEHSKAMQDGMKAMHQMMDAKSANDGAQGMKSRMDMMTMMMQMMMDQQSMGGGMGGGMGRGSGMQGPATPPAK